MPRGTRPIARIFPRLKICAIAGFSTEPESDDINLILNIVIILNIINIQTYYDAVVKQNKIVPSLAVGSWQFCIMVTQHGERNYSFIASPICYTVHCTVVLVILI